MESMGRLMMDLTFFKGKRVFLTGHTGFKGSWMCRILENYGAVLTGYSLAPPTEPNLFSLADVKTRMNSVIGDVRDFGKLKHIFDEAQPEIVIHMAAQPIVREGYRCPRETYETNVMGTVNLMECVRQSSSVKSVLNVTTDNVYLNREWPWGYRENEILDGFDPYSNSKSCSELVTHSYANSFFGQQNIAVSTARAGNVIGGGDFAPDRIIPDCVRAQKQKQTIVLRNPHSVRPYQHVLEPLMAYLMITQRQFEDRRLAGWYNVGPEERDCVSTGQLADMFCQYWGEGASWITEYETDAPHEASFLRLDSSKLRAVFSWKPRWSIRDAVALTCAWSKIWLNGGSVTDEMDQEIQKYLDDNL